ncbi:uncharacterized protein LOC101848197 isoform X2 [Aplysia californica]|uniref:Uncharacterized protein LOC101848197 isoform X2 n=1 Tax=Aplysia californica TaxID=6500 RepID=A0ABM0JM09_APLCA|nr:uncharacterized protein LOC101848197 isoform X2 [Aplysia californica]
MTRVNAPEVNRSFANAGLAVGMGHSVLRRFCEAIGLLCLSLKTHQAIQKEVHKSALQSLQSNLTRARDIVKQLYQKTEDFFHVAVTYDGTWHKRGHTSLHGVAAVICAVSGLVLDVHVMSLHCQLCKVMEKRLKDRPDDLERWKTTHRPKCHKNHTESSGSMEVAAAAVMWGRSEQYGLRYTTMISDGDSKTYNELTKNPPYDGIAVTKGECVNHVSKRIGTQLRNVVADERKRGVTLGGRASGALTQEKIAKL